jgi:hypothetical protein
LHFTISSTLREHSPFNTSSVNDSMLSQLLIYRFWRAWRLMISFGSSSSADESLISWQMKGLLR